MNYQEQIAKIAYELYLKRRGERGDPVQDWLAAERIYEESVRAEIQLRQSGVEPEAVEQKQVAAKSADKSGRNKGEAKVSRSQKKVQTPARPSKRK